MSFIKQLQKKSRSTRILILWLATILVMFIIIIIWLFSFSSNFVSEEEIKKESETSDLPSLFKSIGRDFSIFKQGLEASLKSINLEINEQGEQE